MSRLGSGRKFGIDRTFGFCRTFDSDRLYYVGAKARRTFGSAPATIDMAEVQLGSVRLLSGVVRFGSAWQNRARAIPSTYPLNQPTSQRNHPPQSAQVHPPHQPSQPINNARASAPTTPRTQPNPLDLPPLPTYPTCPHPPHTTHQNHGPI
eukprot:GEMP01120989.1.p1 GENE.GEMP01120989.1~~GEMP01120989.1.p1  ORF type:complete len:151 (-),score=8.24 GEMP01120989.1:59-511(-)